MSIKNIGSVTAIAGALVLLAGCGSSSSSSSRTTPTSSTSKPTAARSTAPATVAQLKKMVLQPADLPPGWKGTPSSDSNDSASQAQLMKCVGAKNTDADTVAEAESYDYSAGEATISSSATSYKSQSDVDSDVAVLRSPKLTPCSIQLFKKILAESLPKGASLGNVTLKFIPGHGTGPANVTGSGLVTVPVSVNGQGITMYINFVYLTGPRIEAEIDAESVGSPVPASVLHTAVLAVAHRVAGSS